MKQKVLVYEKFLRTLPSLVERLQAQDIQILSASGDSALQIFRQELPFAAILAMDMNGSSGLHICNTIKKIEALRLRKIVLVNTGAPIETPPQVVAVGCDLFVNSNDAEEKILEFLKPHLSQKDKDDEANDSNLFRGMAGQFEYFVGDEKKLGDFVNVSESAVLFAADEGLKLGQEIRVRIFSSRGDELEVPVIVAKIAPLKQPRKGFPFGIAARFGELTEIQKTILGLILAFRRESDAKISIRDLIDLLQAPTSFLADLLKKPETKPQLKGFLEEIKDFEKEAFSPSSPKTSHQDLFQKAVLLGVKCKAFETALPSILSNREKYEPTFLSLLPPLLSEIAEVEAQIEISTQAAIDTSQAEIQRTLNQFNNRLYERKTSLFFAIERSYPKERFPEISPAISSIRVQLEKIQSLRKWSANEASRKVVPRPAPAKEEKKKAPSFTFDVKGTKEKRFSSSPILWTSLAVVWLASALLLTWRYVDFGGSVAGLDLPMRVESAFIRQSGLVIRTKRSDWKRLDGRRRNLVFSNVTKFLQSKDLKFSWILDEKNQQMAAVSSAMVGKKRIYSFRNLQ